MSVVLADINATIRVLTLEVARAAAEADAAKAEVARLQRAEQRWLRILDIARDEYEANNGRIIDGRNPHWSVMLRRALVKRRRPLAPARIATLNLSGDAPALVGERP